MYRKDKTKSSKIKNQFLNKLWNGHWQVEMDEMAKIKRQSLKKKKQVWKKRQVW